MEKQLLFLLDYNVRIEEQDLITHFEPFLRPIQLRMRLSNFNSAPSTPRRVKSRPAPLAPHALNPAASANALTPPRMVRCDSQDSLSVSPGYQPSPTRSLDTVSSASSYNTDLTDDEDIPEPKYLESTPRENSKRLVHRLSSQSLLDARPPQIRRASSTVLSTYQQQHFISPHQASRRIASASCYEQPEPISAKARFTKRVMQFTRRHQQPSAEEQAYISAAGPVLY